ncbi:MAG: KH domain-containing protein [Acidimicrobiales bacterium]
MNDADTGSRAETASAVLEYLIRNLVDNPDDVRVDVVDRSGGVQLEVRVAQGDLGRVIGRRGRTASAIRTVTRAAAVRDGVDVNVEFIE